MVIHARYITAIGQGMIRCQVAIHLQTRDPRIRTLLAKRFEIVEVDEFKTSVVCNTCTNRLERYHNRRGRLSHSRFCCTTCGPSLGKERKKRFVDRDINAATNILRAGMSHERPICLSRMISWLVPGGKLSNPSQIIFT